MPEAPEVLIFTQGDEQAAAKELARQIAALDIHAPFVVTSQHGRTLAAELQGPQPHETPVDQADQDWASELGSRAKKAGADAIVAIGGGRALDIGKLAAARAGLTVITVPTMLSHDGLCSPVAVVPDDGGRAESLGAIAPRFVFISLPTLAQAPVESFAAGLGDVLANPLALRDWALAAERGLEEIDQRAWDLSVESFELVEPFLDQDVATSLRDPSFVGKLADALVLSGMAMIHSGTSRPASGAEHEISHAIDELYGGRAMHGAQVAFGCIVSVALYGEDEAAFRGRLAKLGLPHRPEDLDLGAKEMVEVILEAPDTRPGRFTILEESNLDRAGAEQLVARIWGT